jgi:electron transfer flavoprotein alpha/beta subunit
MAAKKKTIDIRSLDSLGLPADDLQPRVAVQLVTLPPPRPPGKVLTGDVSEAVSSLLKLLHEEAKVI